MSKPLDESGYNSLSLKAKAEEIQKIGSFIEAQDFYSFKTYLYAYKDHQVEITYDYSGELVSVEFVESRPNDQGPAPDSSFEQLL